MANDPDHIAADQAADRPPQNASGEEAPPPPSATADESDTPNVNSMLDENEIDTLTPDGQGTAQASAEKGAASPAAPSSPVSSVATSEPDAAHTDIDVLLNRAEAALASIDEGATELPAGVKSFQLDDFSGTAPTTEAATLDLMRDVALDVTIELGRTHMHLEEVLKLQKGAVVPLDKLAGDPVDVFVNGRLIARGEVLVLNDNFCVRVAELIVGESAA